MDKKKQKKQDAHNVEIPPLINLWHHIAVFGLPYILVLLLSGPLPFILQTPTYTQKHDKAITASATWQGALQYPMLVWISMSSLIIPHFYSWQLIRGRRGWNNLIQHASSKGRKAWFSPTLQPLAYCTISEGNLMAVERMCLSIFTIVPCLQCRCVISVHAPVCVCECIIGLHTWL